MEWKRQAKDSQQAAEIADYAGQPVDKVRSLVTALDTHAIITWTNRPRSWEYWRRHAGAWEKASSATSAAEAKDKASQHEAEQAVLDEVRALPTGTALTVTAEWLAPYHGSKPLKLACSSAGTAEVIAGIFKRMGCRVDTGIAA